MQNPNTPKNEIDPLTSLNFHGRTISVFRHTPHKSQYRSHYLCYTSTMDQDTTEIIETLNLILAKMATKDDIEALRVEMREGFANIQAELKDIRLRLDALEVATQNVSGFAKEIDHLLQRVGAIEKHLGIHHNIAA
jgi:hypothetical protein